MFYRLLSVYLFLISFVFIMACQAEKSSSNVILNPNKDSELALLMRDMFDQTMSVKQAIMNNEIVDLELYEKIKTAHATTPADIDTDFYRGMSDSYLANVRDYNESKNRDVDHFNSIVNNCMNCHQTVCPGPMVRIKKLYIDQGSPNTLVH